MSNPGFSIGTEYDAESGELKITETLFDNVTTEIVRVRAEIAEKAIRAAAVYELTRLGYTIISPKGHP